MDGLPTELRVEICSHLSLDDIFNVCVLSRSHYSSLDHVFFWRGLFKLQYPLSSLLSLSPTCEDPIPPENNDKSKMTFKNNQLLPIDSHSPPARDEDVLLWKRRFIFHRSRPNQQAKYMLRVLEASPPPSRDRVKQGLVLFHSYYFRPLDKIEKANRCDCVCHHDVTHRHHTHHNHSTLDGGDVRVFENESLLRGFVNAISSTYSGDVDMLTALFQTIRIISRLDNCVLKFCDMGMLDELAKVLIRYREVQTLQDKGAAILWNFAFTFDDVRRTIAEKGLIEVVVSAMRNFPDNPDIQEQGAGALWNIAVFQPNEIKIGLSGAIAAIISSLNNPIHHAGVLENSCGCLRSLATAKENAEKISALGGVTAIISVMKKYISSSPSVLEQAFAALWNLSSYNDSNDVEIEREGGIDVMMEGLRKHMNSKSLVHQAIGALWNLSFRDSNREQMKKAGGMELLEKAVEIHGIHVGIQENAPLLLQRLRGY